MRIVFISHQSSLYGANQSLLTLIKGLKAHNVQCVVITAFKGPFSYELSRRNIPYILIPFKTWVTYRWKSQNKIYQAIRYIQQFLNGVVKQFYNLGLILNNYKKLKTFEADIFYSNNLLSPFGFYLSRIYNAPHVWHLREFLNLDYNLYPDFGFSLLRRFVAKDKTIAISHAIAKHFISGKNRLYYVIYNGVFDKDKIVVTKLGCKAFRFAIVGILSKNKGQEDAIRALALLKAEGINAELEVNGDGNIDYFKNLATNLGVIDQVSFNGFVRDIQSIYKGIDCILMCSKFEGFGRVTAEAMAFGIPVIGRDAPATNELISNGKNGILYDGTVNDLVKKMAMIVSDYKFSQIISKNARVFAEANFSNDKYCSNVLNVCVGLLNKK